MPEKYRCTKLKTDQHRHHCHDRGQQQQRWHSERQIEKALPKPPIHFSVPAGSYFLEYSMEFHMYEPDLVETRPLEE